MYSGSSTYCTKETRKMKIMIKKITLIIIMLAIIGSNSISVPADDNAYQADIHIKFKKYGAVEYDVKFLIDGEEKAVLKIGKKQDFQIKLKAGEHELRFEKQEDSNVMGKAILNVIRDLECSYTIHGTVEYVSVKENYVEYKDELPEGMVQTTNSSSDFRNMNYKTVVSELKKMGFTNIVKKPIKMGLFNEEGEVASISINGKKGFKRGELFDSDTEVLVKYYSEKAKSEAAPKPTLPPHETVKIGNYGGEDIVWRVLKKGDNATLLITEKIIDYKAFNESTVVKASDWEKSSLRKWLNGDFYQNAFSDEERTAIQTTVVQDYKTDITPGGTTEDYIFILSLEQAFNYFSTDEDRIAQATDYAKKRKKFPANSWTLINSYLDDYKKYLISPEGNIDNKPRVNEAEGIRPAVWVSNDYLK